MLYKMYMRWWFKGVKYYNQNWFISKYHNYFLTPYKYTYIIYLFKHFYVLDANLKQRDLEIYNIWLKLIHIEVCDIN